MLPPARFLHGEGLPPKRGLNTQGVQKGCTATQLREILPFLTKLFHGLPIVTAEPPTVLRIQSWQGPRGNARPWACNTQRSCLQRLLLQSGFDTEKLGEEPQADPPGKPTVSSGDTTTLFQHLQPPQNWRGEFPEL